MEGRSLQCPVSEVRIKNKLSSGAASLAERVVIHMTMDPAIKPGCPVLAPLGRETTITNQIDAYFAAIGVEGPAVRGVNLCNELMRHDISFRQTWLPSRSWPEPCGPRPP